MRPEPTYYSTLDQMFSDTNVERGLDRFYAIESLGIKEGTSNYDDEQIAKFKSSIEFKDGFYHVELPWQEDIIDKVPSNYFAAKVIAKKSL